MLQAASLNTDRGLSTRELEVLGLAAEGESVKEIAGRLYLSSGTVRNYLSAIISKTRARNRLDAIRIARKEGWLR
jgi:two-component system response regulator DesR